MPTLLSTQVETREIIFPAQANTIQSAHGGNLVKWMEQTGAMSGMRFAGAAVVTVSMDDISFHGPIPEASIALVDAYVYDSGSSSIETYVRVFDEDPHTAERTLAADGSVTLVALDDDGDSVTVPDLTVESEDGEQLLATAHEALGEDT